MSQTSSPPRAPRVMSRPSPPVLQNGFRPFFFLASVHAGIAAPAWLLIYTSGAEMPGPFAGPDWHVHEMLFGYLGAVVAGFILTAIPNWTGRLPLRGWPLAGLAALWLAGRLACALLPDPLAALFVDLLFPVTLAGAVWREVVAGRNWKNVPIAAMLTLLGLANAAHHAQNLGLLADGVGVRLGLAVAAMMITLIGGRIVPSFTRNWLVKRGEARLPGAFGLLDRLALAATAVSLCLFVVVPEFVPTGAILVLAGATLAARLARWRGHRTLREPILLILHIGYAWLAAALVALGLSILSPAVPASATLHALTAGAFGTMTLAVMTRASLGHTGREIRADGWISAIYVLVSLGAVLRVAAPFAGALYLPVLMAGGAAWSAAFVLFSLRYAPILLRARLV